MRPRTYLLLTVLVINALVAALLGVSLVQSRAQYEASAAKTSQNLALVLESAISGTLTTSNAVLASTAHEYLRQLTAPRFDLRALNRHIEAEFTQLSFNDSLRIARIDGSVAYGTGVDAETNISIRDRDYFIRLRDHPETSTIISQPVRGRLSGQWIVVLARRVSLPDGTFAGVVFTPITLERFSALFSSISIGARGVVTLRDAELGLVVSQPLASSAEIGSKRLSQTFLDLAKTGVSVGTYDAITVIDGVQRKFSFRKFENEPFYVFVGLAKDEYLAPWRSQVLELSGLMAIFSLSTFALSWLVYRANRQLLRQQAQLRQMAFIDGLTQVANRRRFDEMLPLEWRACRRDGVPLTLLMIDVDHFKQFNDRYGHHAGDECLRAVATTIKACLGRSHDLVARYGGEEFVCLLPDCDAKGAFAKAEELRLAVQALAITHEASATTPVVTISIGAAITTPVDDNHADALLELADAQLYRAKSSGRNRTCLSEDPTPQPARTP